MLKYTLHIMSVSFYTDEWSTLTRMRLLLVVVTFCSFAKTGKDFFLIFLKENSLILEENSIALETGLSRDFLLNSRTCNFILRYNFLTTVQVISSYHPIIVFIASPVQRLRINMQVSMQTL